jgi:hypothetical protein
LALAAHYELEKEYFKIWQSNKTEYHSINNNRISYGSFQNYYYIDNGFTNDSYYWKNVYRNANFGIESWYEPFEVNSDMK